MRGFLQKAAVQHPAEPQAQRAANNGAASSIAAGKLNQSASTAALLQMQQALDRRPKMQSQAALQLALSSAQAAGPNANRKKPVIQKKLNATGLPDRLKAGIEHLSGFSMDDVRVHYNSARPAQLQAWAYSQGTDIHLGPGQERHLPHEAWHVVQQKHGRVKPTLQMKGLLINDDMNFEREADVMGARAARPTRRAGEGAHKVAKSWPLVVQAKWIVRLGKLVEVKDDYQLQGGEAAAESLRLHPIAQEFVDRAQLDRKEGDLKQGDANHRDHKQEDHEKAHTRFLEAAAKARRAELETKGNGSLVKEKTRKLLGTRLHVDPKLEQHFTMETKSKSHNERTQAVASDLFGRMLHNVGRTATHRINESRAKMGDRPLLPDHSALENPSAVLGVGYGSPGPIWTPPHYNPTTNEVWLTEAKRIDHAGHELQHAYDHIHGDLDLNEPSHRIASELNAFTQQQKVSLEATGTPPEGWVHRTPQAMAESYHGKKTYPGTLKQSLAAVAEWQAKRAQKSKGTIADLKEKQGAIAPNPIAAGGDNNKDKDKDKDKIKK